MRNRKILLTLILLATSVVLLTQCVGRSNSESGDPRGPLYAGAATCQSCHKDIMQSYAHTNHYRTSAKTSFADLKRIVDVLYNRGYYEDSQFVQLSQKHGAFFQSYLANGDTVRSEKLDVAIGSGEKAQTFAYWKNDQLFQLPLTFFASLKAWTNSPGFPAQRPYYDRVVLSRCLECHGSYAEKEIFETGPLQVSEKMAPNSIIYGIDCERCHGPAAEHVSFHEEHPSEKFGKMITSIKSLTRQQQLDLCASCHSGNDIDVQQTLFAFKPGDTLANFYFPHFGTGKEPDVHGKQLQLLLSSKCFKQSTMTCITCHNTPHADENRSEVLVSKCMDCHKQSPHAIQLQSNPTACLNCHMPEQESKSLDFNNGKERRSIPYMLRTHRVAVYPK